MFSELKNRYIYLITFAAAGIGLKVCFAALAGFGPADEEAVGAAAAPPGSSSC